MTACREFTSAVDVVNQIVAEGMGVNRTDHRLLEILNRKGAMTAGDLAKAGHVTTGAVTAVVDRLEEAGFVRRVRDSEDRRRVLIERTPESTKSAMRYYGPFMNRTFQSMAKYSAEELEVIRDFMRSAAELSDDYAKELRARAAADPPGAAETG
jgi:DNA-binding MarR family transcriptional regulator